MSAATTRSTSLDIADIVEADLDHLVHPYSVIDRVADTAPLFRSGHGLTLIDIQGNDWIDACSGLLNVNIGYGRHELAEVAAETMKELCYANLFFGRGSVTSALLAQKLADITPDGITRFFYTQGGSDAVDTVIKLVRYANAVAGRPEKHRIIGRFQSYHGMSLGALSMTGDPELWECFGPLVPGFSHIAQPDTDGAASAKLLEDEILAQGPDNVAAFIAEPVSMPARINIPPTDYWPAVREICTRYDVQLVTDETITGFGRTGRLFAVEHWGVKPDLMITSKGLTSGYLPLGAVGMTEAFVERLRGGGRNLYHGFTAAGHPVACAVALANIEIMEREDLVAHGARTGAYLVDQLQALSDRHSSLAGARGIGILAAADIAVDVVGEQFGRELLSRFLAERVLVREYDDGATFGFAPPLSSTERDIDEILRRVETAISKLEGDYLA